MSAPTSSVAGFASRCRSKVDDETVTAPLDALTAPTCAGSPRPVHSWSPITGEAVDAAALYGISQQQSRGELRHRRRKAVAGDVAGAADVAVGDDAR